METVNSIKIRLRKSLRSQSTYTKDLEMCISMVATSYYSMLVAQRDMENLDTCYIKESDRYGNTKLVTHPCFKVLKDMQENVRKGLRELGLTLKTLSSDANDGVNDFMDKVNG